MSNYIDNALQALELGHLTRYQAADVLTWVMNNDPQRANIYTQHINALIRAGDIIQKGAAWVAVDTTKKKGGRPRGRRDRQRVAVYLPPELVAALDAHPLARYQTRNALIAMAIEKWLITEQKLWG